MLGSWKPVLASFVGLVLWSGSVGAQCPVPDGLDGGPCCTVAPDNIPTFPKFTQDALEICWQNCNVDQVISYVACWNNLHIAPIPGIPCGERRVRLDLKNTAGVLQWTGTLRLQYSRTWLETDPAGFPLQVWRFLVNGDMRPFVTMPIPCPVPPCVPAFGNKARFTGYVDYAQSCAVLPALYQHAWMLTHSCDTIDHRAGFPRAGAFHPDRAYTFVGPAAGFVPGPIQPTEGTPGSPFEALRRRNLPPVAVPETCEFEERLSFSLMPQQQLCLCGLVAAPLQYMIANLMITGVCGTSVTTPGGPFLPGFVSMGIGAWTLGGIYPGMENLRWNAGGYDYLDPCPPALRREVFFGVTTIGGYPARQLLAGGPAGPLPLTFIDQSNSLTPPGGGTVMNVPYVSDHILNLNH
jgi:hypothetical protein